MHHHSSTHPAAASAYDVIIVGARAAGAATAMLLARGGLRVLVVERGAPQTDTLSTHALMRGGVLQLRRWGLLDTIVANGTPAIRHTSFRYANDRIDITIKPTHGVDALYAPRRTVLDPTIAQAAIDAGAEIRYRTTLTGLVHRGGRVVGARLRTAGSEPSEISAELVIGADGIRSVVADLVAAPVLHRARHSTAVTYGYWSGLDTDGYEWIFRPDACSGVIPTNNGEACVFASARPARIGRGGPAVIADIVAEGDPELASRLAAASPPKGTRTWNGQLGYIRRSFGPGWALVGDAGYFKDPITAHGLTDALRDAELLARAVIDGIGDDAALHARLAEYQRLRDRISLALFETADRIAANDWGDAEIAGLLKHLSASMEDEIETLVGLDLERV